MYCQNMVNIQTPFLAANQTLLATGQSPVTAVGNNLSPSWQTGSACPSPTSTARTSA